MIVGTFPVQVSRSQCEALTSAGASAGCMARSSTWLTLRTSICKPCLHPDLKSPLNKSSDQCNEEEKSLLKAYSKYSVPIREAQHSKTMTEFFFLNFDSHVSQQTVGHLLPMPWDCGVYASGIQTLPLRIVGKKGKELAPEGKWIHRKQVNSGPGDEVLQLNVCLASTPRCWKIKANSTHVSKPKGTNLRASMEGDVKERE